MDELRSRREELVQKIKLLESRISMTDANYYDVPRVEIEVSLKIVWFTIYRKDNTWELTNEEVTAIRMGYQAMIDKLQTEVDRIDNLLFNLKQ